MGRFASPPWPIDNVKEPVKNTAANVEASLTDLFANLGEAKAKTLENIKYKVYMITEEV